MAGYSNVGPVGLQDEILYEANMVKLAKLPPTVGQVGQRPQMTKTEHMAAR